MTAPLRMWTIYDHPADYPEGFIARQFLVTATGLRATENVIKAATLEEVRRRLRLRGLDAPLGRDESDDPTIVETWV